MTRPSPMAAGINSAFSDKSCRARRLFFAPRASRTAISLRAVHQWDMEVLLPNADDRVSLAVQLDSLVQFRFEPLTPQSVTDDSYMSRSELVLAVEEVAAGRRLHAEHAEKVGRDASAFHALRDCAAREVEFVRDPSR